MNTIASINRSDKPSIKTKKSIMVFTVLLLSSILLWLASGLYVTDRLFPETVEVGESMQHAMAMRGQFGDMFGGINALFTSLALAGAIFTIWIQQTQIKFLQAEQSVLEKDRNRSARLMAMSALVNAKGILLSTRHAAAMENNSILESSAGILGAKFRSNLATMINETAQKAANDFPF